VINNSRRQTRAELCVPVIVDQRLIGTLNFESAHPHAFSLVSNVGKGCAAMVAIAVAAIRRHHLRDILSVGTEVQQSVHDLTKVDDRLRRLVSTSPEMERDLKYAADQLAVVLAALRGDRPPQGVPDGSASDLLPIVKKAALRAGVPVFRSARVADLTPTCDLHIAWPERSARRFFLALFEVFQNISAKANTDSLPDIGFDLSQIGGRRQIEITIVNHTAELSQINVQGLYRVPIPGDDRVHIGAYMAGAIMRSLGGDIVADRVGESGLLTHISVPDRIQGEPHA
jgi:hypothetical protein